MKRIKIYNSEIKILKERLKEENNKTM